MIISEETIQAGQAIYKPWALRIYNLVVIYFANSFAWRCPRSTLLDHYQKNISAQHLDIGIGSGWFLDKVKFPSTQPELSLLDLNPNCLQHCKNKLQRYTPTLYCADVFKPLTLVNKKFDSVGINYLLHCLPGSLKEKEIVIANCANLLSENGVLFGSTILGKDTQQNFLARFFMKIYNKKGIFSNTQDDAVSLECLLKKHFTEVEIRRVGMVALFRGQSLIKE